MIMVKQSLHIVNEKTRKITRSISIIPFQNEDEFWKYRRNFYYTKFALGYHMNRYSATQIAKGDIIITPFFTLV